MGRKKGALPAELTRLEAMLRRALDQTAPLWPPIQIVHRWLQAVVAVLENPSGLCASQVKRRFSALLANITRWQTHAGTLQPAIAHFLKVTRSYWSGLFHCYDLPHLPRNNNDLEHLFGRQRYHERRTTGRKVASPSLVIRGSVRIVATLLTRLHPFSASDLIPPSLADWHALRTRLAAQRYQRTLQRRFRQDPDAYLADLEGRLLQLILPL